MNRTNYNQNNNETLEPEAVLRRRISSPHAEEETDAFLPAETGLQPGVRDDLPAFHEKGVKKTGSNLGETFNADAVTQKLQKLADTIKETLSDARRTLEISYEEAGKRLAEKQGPPTVTERRAESSPEISKTAQTKETLMVLGEKLLGYVDELRSQLSEKAGTLGVDVKTRANAAAEQIREAVGTVKEKASAIAGKAVPSRLEEVPPAHEHYPKGWSLVSPRFGEEETAPDVIPGSSPRHHLRHDVDQPDPDDPLGVKVYHGRTSSTHMGASPSRDF